MYICEYIHCFHFNDSVQDCSTSIANAIEDIEVLHLVTHFTGTSCGFVATSPPTAGDVIIDDTEAESKSIPWQASLLRQGQHICGLSVVHAEWLVTAAHCL